MILLEHNKKWRVGGKMSLMMTEKLKKGECHGES
jgi:hypothetical protein